MAFSPTRSLIRNALLAISNVTFPLAILTFAAGFFPYKPFLPGRNSFTPGQGAMPKSQFNKVIFMVVDALRSDFVYSNESSFFFTHSLIRDGSAIPFTAHATSPTITMPRIKAMTTGSIPSFLDVILNFAESDTTSTLTNQDTWPTQLKSKSGGKLLMYGDDTWLKLFPNIFSRADGTSSFFVSDFTEVDHNVTRHLADELEQSDWDGFIMHYLGLDHIGHKSGPRRSPYMAPKQREMDGIIKQIYEAIKSKEHLQSTLLVLCGDHGMNDAGNHGGSAPGETSPALVFISPKLQSISQGRDCPAAAPKDDFQYFQRVEQSDVAPTLAGLLGFPIPRNNLGVIIPSMLDLWSLESDRIKLLQQNAQQILSIIKATFPSISFDEEPRPEDCLEPLENGARLWCMWQSNESLTLGDVREEQKISELLEFLRRAQNIMSTTASNYDLTSLHIGVLLSGLSTICALISIMLTGRLARSVMAWGMIITVGYGATMFASSFVEEEHHFWYWLGSGWLGWLFATKSMRTVNFWNPSSLAAITLFASFRTLRRWNQTGQKHAGEPDIGKTFLPAQNELLWLLLVATYCELGRRLVRGYPSSTMRAVFVFCASAVCICAFTFKVAFINADAPELLRGIPTKALNNLGLIPLVLQAQIVFSGILLLATMELLQMVGRNSLGKLPSDIPRTLHNLLSLFLVTQTRVTNIPIFLIFFYQLEMMKVLNLNLEELTLTSIIFQFSSFFAFGGSNAISSIDLSSAYNGVNDYNMVAVGILTFVGNWAGPIWWANGSHLLLMSKSGHIKEPLIRYICLLTFFFAGSLLSTMAACTTLRTHLFIWTVFSPKYLYTIAWSLGQHIGINIVLGLVMGGVARR